MPLRVLGSLDSINAALWKFGYDFYYRYWNFIRIIPAAGIGVDRQSLRQFMNQLAAGIVLGIGITIAVQMCIIAILNDVPEVDPNIDFDHIDMEDLNDKIEIKDDFNAAVKTPVDPCCAKCGERLRGLDLATGALCGLCADDELNKTTK